MHAHRVIIKHSLVERVAVPVPLVLLPPPLVRPAVLYVVVAPIPMSMLLWPAFRALRALCKRNRVKRFVTHVRRVDSLRAVAVHCVPHVRPVNIRIKPIAQNAHHALQEHMPDRRQQHNARYVRPVNLMASPHNPYANNVHPDHSPMSPVQPNANNVLVEHMPHYRHSPYAPTVRLVNINRHRVNHYVSHVPLVPIRL